MDVFTNMNMIMDSWQLPGLFPGANVSFLNTETQFARMLLSALDQAGAAAGPAMSPQSTITQNLEALAGGVSGSTPVNRPSGDAVTPTKSHIVAMADNAARTYGVNPKLVQSVISAESGYDPNAVSHAGAEGLMQLMPQTARDLGVQNPMNPAENINGGVRYLKQMLDRYHGNVFLALAAYNAGPGAVDKAGGIPHYPETQNYVREVLGHTFSAMV